MEEIRIGIAGLGHRGVYWAHLLAQTPGYRITAMCDPFEPLHANALAEVPDNEHVKTFTDYRDFLAHEAMDAVALCVRCEEQGAMAAEALEAGKHVNAEVPAAHSIEDCWKIVLAAERTGKVYHLAEQVRYAGFVRAWRKLVAQGRLGKVTFVEGQYFGYYADQLYFQDAATGQYRAVDEVDNHPNTRGTWVTRMPPIHYLPHELSPMLHVLDDRVVEVTAMGNSAPSKRHPRINQPDMQAALMKTEKDAVLRMAVSFTQPVSEPRGHHWFQIMGTGGSVELARSGRERPKLWLADGQMNDMADVDWPWTPTDVPAAWRKSGHGGLDAYVHHHFREAVMNGKPLDIDLYQAMDTAAPAILAAESIAQGSRPMRVPDFRPGPHRRPGEAPPEA